MTFFKTENISIDFGGIRAVNDVSFDVEKGTIFTIVGPNGAGKTTIFNIISNASESIQNNAGLIEIATARENEKNFEIKITDSGRGIPRDKVKNIFNPFFSSKIYGPGLGLTFADRTVKSHKGAIHVKSEEGKGTTIKIRLPI